MKKSISRLSLAQLQDRLGAGTSEEIDEGATPTLRDLAETLSFSPGDGRIWLNDQRMVLWRSSTYGALRRELIASMGQEPARSLLTRVGYAAGARDAELVRRTWPDSDPVNAFHAGPRMHKLEGIVRPETIRFEFDIARGDFFADYWWHDSSEDDEHIAAFGIGTESACWMQVGYASGYASAFMGKLIIYREVACRSSGAEVCRIVGRPADQWEDPELDQHYFTPDASAERVRRALVPVVSQVSRPRADKPQPAGAATELIGISSSFSAARHLIERVAPTQATVLFTGPSGAGKELFAQTLHRISPRHPAPFVAVNCAAIPDTLIESELFGVERGAFTGATESRAGRFERAKGGTLFLDEIASLSLVAQGKLLRALQERVIERVGGLKVIAVDVRVVAATNVSLRDEVAAGLFRQDLFFRLNVFPITLPSLRERRDDIPLLMEAFLRRYAQLHAREVPGFTPRAVQALLQYDFPGNIRELQNLVERGVIMAAHDEPVDVHHLFRGGEHLQAQALGLDTGGRLTQAAALGADGDRLSRPAKGAGNARGPSRKDAAVYRKALVAARFNVAEAARQLGLTRAQMAYRCKRLGVI
ncbi:sigma-54-dependent Fis family transcriptional regulator [Variovorax terrae]|uniref:Sigma-54-dependent Fis family transcriptional regulator n=1 Tax=Variovorax terrae TaxID=2923278 RepID=A0A9X2ANX8_9BURK|nr:sigma-54-dependent Fis family transcriptional regulator [Variovorax terrae]MCJ0764839.1 sigma-54-dependent Fis family transcriptional regulator [Variovorax terrae]